MIFFILIAILLIFPIAFLISYIVKEYKLYKYHKEKRTKKYFGYRVPKRKF